MSTTEQPPPPTSNHDAPMVDDAPASGPTRKRPKLDLAGALGGTGGRAPRRGVMGLLVGTLNKAKIEDKERNASEAAKKRQMIEQRLQAKLRKETDTVRRQEEARKDKTTASRKEEDLQLKDSLQKLQRTRLPILANFLLTTDVMPAEDSMTDEQPSTKDLLAGPRKANPPPLYYLPAVLLPVQEAFLKKRKAEVTEAAEKEWAAFAEERQAGVVEIDTLRRRAAEARAELEAARKVAADAVATTKAAPAQDAEAAGEAADGAKGGAEAATAKDDDVDMDVEGDDKASKASKSKGEVEEAKQTKEAVEREIREETMGADDEDAVEY